MDFFSSPDLWIAFLTLFALELVLGIDNVVFISILVSRLPESQRQRARIIGLSLALVLRIVLLFAASWVIGLTDPIVSIGSATALEVSGRDLILIVGGLFLVYKAVTEIHEKLEGAEGDHGSAGPGGAATSTMARVLVQIVLIDAVFSLDSVITAVGMVDQISIMIAAVVLSIGLMMVLASRISAFVDKHPTVKMLALSFLVLIGATLVAEGFDVHIDKAVIYGPIAFAIAVEALNLSYRSRVAKRAGRTTTPVHLHSPYAASPTPGAGARAEGEPGAEAATPVPDDAGSPERSLIPTTTSRSREKS